MKVTVIGAGIVGMTVACSLRREGHDVTVVTMHPPGEYCSFGNAGMLNNAGCVPQAMPGVMWKVPGYLTDPLGPLVVRWSHLARSMPWMLRFLANANVRQAEHASIALYSLIRDTVPAYEELLKWAGAPELVRRSGYLVAYDSEKSYQGDALAWSLRHGARQDLIAAYLHTPLTAAERELLHALQNSLEPVDAQGREILVAAVRAPPDDEPT